MPAFGLIWFTRLNPALLSVPVHSRGPSRDLNHDCNLATIYAAILRSKHDYKLLSISDETLPWSHSLPTLPSKGE